MDLSKRDIEGIVNKIVDKKIERVTKSFSNKKDIRKMIGDDIDTFYNKLKKEKNSMSEEETKEIVRKSIINLYKLMWEKSNFFIKNI